MKTNVVMIIITLLVALCLSCTPEVIVRDIDKVEADYKKGTDVTPGTSFKDGGLLFAHMTDKDYGRLFYMVSKDGMVWTSLNDGNKINTKYRGHPDIVKGPDDKYYMISGIISGSNEATLFTSEDLITWKTTTTITKAKVWNAKTGYTADGTYFGAPKLFYDEDSEQWIITWHATHGATQDFTKMRTLYVLTSDFKTFTKPEFLFDFQSEEEKDIVTIDVIIRKIGGRYWAIYKDEREQDIAPKTYKTIRISTSDYLTGPYSEPSDPITPHWFEAPTIAQDPNDQSWHIWAENYPNAYHRFDIGTMSTTGWRQFSMPLKGIRHGCVVRISQDEYDALMEAFGPEETEE